MQVVPGVHRSTWCSCSVPVTDIGYVVWLINSDPKLDFVAKTAKDEVSIVPEFHNNGLIFPAPNILQSLWKVPVVESDLTTPNDNTKLNNIATAICCRTDTYMWLDVCSKQCIHQPVVVV